jgi:sugar phosphate isomerase/epimerase
MFKKRAVKLKNKIATSSHILSLYDIHEAIDILGKAGYDAIEMWAEELDLQLKHKKTSLQKVRSALKRNRMVGVVHAPLYDPGSPSHDKYNLCSKDEAVRARSIDAHLHALDLAKRFGFKVMTVHPGHTDDAGERADKAYWYLQIAAFRKIARYAKRCGVRIGMEPMENKPREFITESKHVYKILDAVSMSNLGVTFDLVHTYTHGEHAPLEFIDKMHKSKIFHVHISGHTSQKTHVPFFMTRIHHRYFDRVIGSVIKNYSGIISIEGAIKGVLPVTKSNQRMVVRKNMEYIHKEMTSLHLKL